MAKCRLKPILGVLALCVCTGPAAAQPAPVRNRLTVLVDTSSEMLLSNAWTLSSESCTGWDPCTFNGNPTAAQETCNACVRDTVNFRPTCATTWSATCRSDYATCLSWLTGASTCSATMSLASGVPTRGDGSLELPGCDLDGDGEPRESRLYAAKQSVRNLSLARSTIELSLWRYRQISGGQTCTTDATCPDTPMGQSVLTCEDHDGNAGTAKVCAFDADLLDGPTAAGFEGQCSPTTFTGSPAGFSCAACDAATTFDRATCEFRGLEAIRTGGTSPIDGATVSCLPQSDPTHRFSRDHGAIWTGSACDPAGGERLVDFPATGFDDNRSQVAGWVDSVQTPFSTDMELRAHGRRPLAAALRDLRAATLAKATADTHTPCRGYRIVAIATGAETCESAPDAVAAAANLQNLSFTNAGGVFVPDFDVPVHVIALATCPPGDPSCAARQDLDAIAAAGATGQAIGVQTPDELLEALAQIAVGAESRETCNGLDDDCDGAIDEGCTSSLSPEPPSTVAATTGLNEVRR